jgi:hypothetical protein
MKEISQLIQDINSDNTDLVMAACQALGQSQNELALQPLLDALSSWRQSMAIEALGELRNPQAIEPLLKLGKEILNQPQVSQAINGQLNIDEEDFDESLLQLLPLIVIALAKLGNYEIAPITLLLTHYKSDDIYSDAEIVRTNATKALQYVVIPGIFAFLKVALHDDYDEVRLEAIDAMFYLGTREAIIELISCVDDENSIVLNNVLVRLHDLTGMWFQADTQEVNLQKWWEEHQAEYKSEICYRLGKPIHIPSVIALLEESHKAKPIIQELKIITGVDFGSYPEGINQGLNLPIQIAQLWWIKEGHKFEDGCLYKYGYKQDIHNIYK